MPSALKLTGYALATYVNGAGSNAHPGIDGMAKATGLHRATVIRSLSQLEQAGFIRAVFRGGTKGVGRGKSTVWELSVPDENSSGRQRPTAVHDQVA